VEDRKFICPCYRHEQDIAETGHCICHLFVDDDYEPDEVPLSRVRADDSPWPPIVVYGAYWCTHTRSTASYLNSHGIPYTFVDVETDLEGARRVKVWNRGYLSTPTLDIGGRITTEPSNEELADLLGL
jgi:glutaredoxin